MGYSIGRLFHPTLVAPDLAGTDDWTRRVFGVTPRHGRFHEGGQRHASFALIGDALVEVMAPLPESTTSLARFRDREGTAWHSFAWYVDGIDDLHAVLTARGLKLTSADFTDASEAPSLSGEVADDAAVADDPWLGARNLELYTHPKQTPGMHEFAQPVPSWMEYWVREYDPRPAPGWRPADPADSPVGVVRLAWIAIAVANAGPAADFFLALDGTPVAPVVGDRVGERSAWLRFGADTVVRLVEPTGEGPVRELLGGRSSMPWSIAFEVVDADCARDHLRRERVPLRVDDEHGLLVADGLGRIEFVARSAR